MALHDLKQFGGTDAPARVRCVLAPAGKPVQVRELADGDGAAFALFAEFGLGKVEGFYHIPTGRRRELRILSAIEDEGAAEPNVAVWLDTSAPLGTVRKRPRGAAGRVPDDVLFGPVFAYVEDEELGWVSMTDGEAALACALLEPRLVPCGGGYRAEGGTKVAGVPTLGRSAASVVVFDRGRQPVAARVSVFGDGIPTARLARALDTDVLECVYRQESEVEPGLTIEVWCGAFSEQDGERPNRALMLEGRYGPVVKAFDRSRPPARNELIFGCFLVYVTMAGRMVTMPDVVRAEIESWFPVMVAVGTDAEGHEEYVYSDWDHYQGDYDKD